MRVAVSGATGSIGAPIAGALADRGHEVRALSRRAPEFPVDLQSGAGLEAALEGCEVVVDAANAGPAEGPARAVLLDGNARLIEAARAAGVGHVLSMSIVGIERVPLPYYRVKVEQEALIEDSGLEFTIVRATQFHGLIDMLFAAAGRYHVLPGIAARLQPVDPDEVARVVAEVAEGGPVGGRVSVGGPVIHELRELAALWRSARGRRALIARLPLPTELGRALRDGALTDMRADHLGERTFTDWLSRKPA